MNNYFNPPDDADFFTDKDRRRLKEKGKFWALGEEDDGISSEPSITADIDLWSKYKRWLETPRGFIEQRKHSWSNQEEFIEEYIQNTSNRFTNLYDKKERFISELIQNADDAHYDLDLGEVPTFILKSFPEKLVVQFNEIGFNKRDVSAICTIANSSKADRKGDATGEKGIGFRSVFLVTHTPQIHSGPWHFGFDSKTNPTTGLVQPEWIGTEAKHFEGTKIILPLDKDFVLPNEFDELIEPTTLLFLRNLERLEFHNHANKTKVIYTKQKLTRNFARLTTERFMPPTGGDRHEETVRDFFIHSQSIDTSEINEKEREGLSSTKVKIAFPLDAKNRVIANYEDGHAFSFLPVRETDLPFLLHGDFVLAADRQKILQDNEWNRAVRDGLGECLADAVLTALQKESPGASIFRALKNAVPIKDGFMREIMQCAIDLLKEKDCIPTIDDNLRNPKQAVIVPKQLIPLFNRDRFCQQLNTYFAKINPPDISTQLMLLGVEQKLLTALLRDIAKQSDASNCGWLQNRKPSWWASLYSTADSVSIDNYLKKATTDQKENIPLFPLADGTISSANNAPYKALSRDISKQYKFKPDNIPILNPEIIKAAEDLNDDERECFKDFLKAFGIKPVSPRDVIEKYILTFHLATDATEREPGLLISHLQYVHDHLDDYIKSCGDQETIPSDLGKNLLAKNTSKNGGQLFSKINALYLGDAYGELHGLEELFSADIEGRRISADYLVSNTELDDDKNKKRWGEFFRRLGAIELPQPIVTGEAGSEDWPIEIKNCLEDVGSERQTTLLALLAKNWPSIHIGERLVDQLSQIHILCSVNNKVALSDCYVDSEENRAVFGEDVPFLPNSLNHLLEPDGINDEFAQSVGLKIRPTLANLLARLKFLSEKQDQNPPVEIYKQLAAEMAANRTKIESEFLNHPLLLAYENDTPTWVTRDEVCWEVPPKLIKHMKQAYLYSKKYKGYEGYSALFKTDFKVKDGPDPNAYLDVLASFSKEPPDDDLQNICGAIYQAINKQICLETYEKDPWVNRLSNENLFCSTTGEWCAPGDNIYVRDDETIASLFKSNPNIHFLDIENSRVKSLEKLFKVTDFKKLSTSFTVDSNNIGKEPNDDLISDVLSTQALRGLCRFFYHTAKKTFEAFADNGNIEFLKQIRGFTCAPLLLNVKLATETAEHLFACRLFEHNGEFLFNDEAKDNVKEIAREIIRYTGLRKEDLLTVSEIIKSDDSRRGILDELNIPELPPESAQEYFDDVVYSLHDETQDEITTTVNLAKNMPSTAAANAIGTPPVTNLESPSNREPSVANERVERAEGTEKQFPDDGRQQDISVDTPSSHATRDRDGHEGEAVTSRPTDNEVVDETNTQAARGTSDPPLQYLPGSSGNRRRGGQQRHTTVQRERMRSYVVPDNAAIRDHMPNEDATKQVEEDAVQFVMEFEKQKGRYPVDANEEHANNPGYDIASYTDAEHSNLERYIEVKGLQRAWEKAGVAVTQPQHDFARKHKDRAWLYVVEYAGSPNTQLHPIQNYANRIWRYHLDYGWKNIDELNDRHQNQEVFPNPVEGMQVKIIKTGQVGEVRQITPYGQFKEVTVEVENEDDQPVRWAEDTVIPMPTKE